MFIFPPGFPGIPPVFIFGLGASQEKISDAYNRICDTLNFEGDFSDKLIDDLSKCFRDLDINLSLAEFVFQTLLKKDHPQYTSYLADVTLIKVKWNHKLSIYQKSEYWPSAMLHHRFDTGIEGQVRVRRKPAFFTLHSELMTGSDQIPLKNPITGFEDKILVTMREPAPLQDLINIDIQNFLLQQNGEYPLRLMDNPFDGIYIGKQGVFYIVRRTVKVKEISEIVMLGEKFTSMIRGLLDLES